MHTDEQSKYWCGTEFDMGRDFAMVPDYQYIVYQRELCPCTGRLHYQFFVQFVARKRFKQVQEMFKGTHIERVKDVEACIKYVTKDETRVEGPFELGSRSKRKSKCDVIAEVRKRSVRDVIAEFPELWRSVRPLRECRLMFAERRQTKTDLWLFHGNTGGGKTTIAQKISSYLGYDDTYDHDGSAWWDGYDQQALCLVDEYRGSFPVQLLLKLGDSKGLKVPFKGGYAEFNTRLVIFISNLTPDSLFAKYDWATEQALRRRFNIFEFVRPQDVN